MRELAVMCMVFAILLAIVAFVIVLSGGVAVGIYVTVLSVFLVVLVSALKTWRQ